MQRVQRNNWLSTFRSSHLKSKVGNTLVKVSVLHVNLNLDGTPITSKSHTHPCVDPSTLVFSLSSHRILVFSLTLVLSIHDKQWNVHKSISWRPQLMETPHLWRSPPEKNTKRKQKTGNTEGTRKRQIRLVCGPMAELVPPVVESLVCTHVNLKLE
jgi:hypothetical protein